MLSLKSFALGHRRSDKAVISMTDGRMRYVRGRSEAGRAVQVRAWGEESFSDTHGLHQALRRAGLAGLRQGILVLPSADYQLAQVEVPDVPEEEMSLALRWKVKDLIDYPAEEAVVEAVPLPSIPGAQGQIRAAHVVIARASVLAEKIRECDQARFSMGVIDIPETSQRNLALFCDPDPGAVVALLHVGKTGGMITISADGDLFLSRRFDIGTPAANDGRAPGEEVCGRIVLELQRSLDSFERRFSFLSLNGLHLVAGDWGDALAAHLGQHLGLSVVVQDLSRMLDFCGCPVPTAMQQVDLCHLLGALVRDAATASSGRRIAA